MERIVTDRNGLPVRMFLFAALIGMVLTLFFSTGCVIANDQPLARSQATVIVGNARFTVLTPRFIRFFQDWPQILAMLENVQEDDPAFQPYWQLLRNIYCLRKRFWIQSRRIPDVSGIAPRGVGATTQKHFLEVYRLKGQKSIMKFLFSFKSSLLIGGILIGLFFDSNPIEIATSTDQSSLGAVFISDVQISGEARTDQSEFKAVYIADTQISNDTTKDARLRKFVRWTNSGRVPGVELLLHGGDVVSSVYDEHPEQFPQQAKDRLAKAVGILNQLTIPYYLAMGNHDYKLWSDRDSDTYFPEDEILQMEKVWKSHTGRPPYYAVEHRGWNFIILNSMRGRYLHRHFDDAQLQFFEKELQKGLPTIVVTHFPLKTDHFKIWAKPKDLITSKNEPRFFALLKKYQDRIKGIFVGHGHMWRQDTLFDRIPVYEVDDFAEEEDMPHYVIEFYSNPYRIVVKRGVLKD